MIIRLKSWGDYKERKKKPLFYTADKTFKDLFVPYTLQGADLNQHYLYGMLGHKAYLKWTRDKAKQNKTLILAMNKK